MLKKRILAFHAAIILSASMMAAVIAPIGNIAIVKANEPEQEATYRKKVYWYNMPGNNYGYDPGSVVEKFSGKGDREVVTGVTINLSMTGATSPTTNYKKQIDWKNEAGVTIHGLRTINETADYTETPFAITSIKDLDKNADVPASDYAKYVTSDSSGNFKVIGAGKFCFEVTKHFNGFSTWEVKDVYEDGVTEIQKVNNENIRYYNVNNPEKNEVEKVSGYTFTKVYYVNSTDNTGTNFRYSNGYGTKETKAAFPTNGSFKIHGTQGYSYWNTDEGIRRRDWIYSELNDSIRVGESSVIKLDAYEPMNTSSNYDDDDALLAYHQYDSSTDTYTEIGAVRTIKETLVGQPKVDWTITSVSYNDEKGYSITTNDAATIATYAEIKNGIFVGKKACTATVTVTCTVTSNFTAKNIWDDGITEEYTFNQGYNDGKDINNEAVYTRTAEITVKDSSDDSQIYARQLRLNDISFDFGSFNKSAKEIKLGKGEAKSVADAWGSYFPNNDSNLDTFEKEFVFYDKDGKRQVRRAQYTLVENNKSITHEYTSSNEKKAKVDKNGNVTGKNEGRVTITDKATVRSTFKVTFTWDDGKVQTIETGDQIKTFENHIKVEVVNAAKSNQNLDVVTVGTGKYVVYTDTKTASFKAPTKKTAKKYTIPVKIKVNGADYKVVGVENKALSGYTKLQQLTVKAKVNTLGTSVLSGCTGLTSADLTNVKMSIIPAGTFTKCKKLTKLTINGNSLMYIDDEAFDGIPKGCTITIKAKDKKTYNSVVKEFKAAGYTKFKFKFKKFKG